jgi:hypothetical protein
VGAASVGEAAGVASGPVVALGDSLAAVPQALMTRAAVAKKPKALRVRIDPPLGMVLGSLWFMAPPPGALLLCGG